MAISAIWIASLDAEKPVVWVEPQIAKMISDSVSDTTVAPIVTTIGSKSTAPRRATMGRLIKVCDASSEPITIAGING